MVVPVLASWWKDRRRLFAWFLPLGSRHQLAVLEYHVDPREILQNTDIGKRVAVDDDNIRLQPRQRRPELVGAADRACSEELTNEERRRILSLNPDGPFLLSHAALGALKAAGKATIVNIASAPDCSRGGTSARIAPRKAGSSSSLRSPWILLRMASA